MTEAPDPVEPSDAELARTLVATTTTGMLATHSAVHPGFPFGSVVTYAADADGRPVLWLSDLAEHSRNLAADARASLLVADDRPGDPLAHARATLLGAVTALDGAERDAAAAVYRAAHPGSYVQDFHDFRLYRLAVDAVRFVGGFARMSWVDAQEYGDAQPDPVAPFAAGVIEHMNDDHADALVTYCRFYAGLAVESARMTSVDRYGFRVAATDAADARQDVRISFDGPVATPDEVRKAMITLLRRARGEA
ncbi:HugZ family protein [Pseudonocardia sp.]|uniref:HugZ family pyridoxamine 5'-phosphate oxidase n=1 Tax=Pseudonocardia sp. TaxID=60912 RepID=UPI003D0D01A9